MKKAIWKLYEHIDKYPYRSLHDISKDMSWSRKKISKYLNRLIEYGIVKHKIITLYDDHIDLRTGFYATPWQQLINWKEFNKKEV